MPGPAAAPPGKTPGDLRTIYTIGDDDYDDFSIESPTGEFRECGEFAI
jgi:hypothetical protein